MKTTFTLSATDAPPSEAARYMCETGLSQVTTRHMVNTAIRREPRRGFIIYQTVVPFDQWFFTRRWWARYVELFSIPRHIRRYESRSSATSRPRPARLLRRHDA